jgi:hypothetical protein
VNVDIYYYQVKNRNLNLLIAIKEKLERNKKKRTEEIWVHPSGKKQRRFNKKNRSQRVITGLTGSTCRITVGFFFFYFFFNPARFHSQVGRVPG